MTGAGSVIIDTSTVASTLLTSGRPKRQTDLKKYKIVQGCLDLDSLTTTAWALLSALRMKIRVCSNPPTRTLLQRMKGPRPVPDHHADLIFSSLHGPNLGSNPDTTDKVLMPLMINQSLTNPPKFSANRGDLSSLARFMKKNKPSLFTYLPRFKVNLERNTIFLKLTE